MASRPRISRPAPPGDFDSRFVTLKKCKSFAGGNYELTGANRSGDKWVDLVKCPAGESDWFEHTLVMQSVTGYWNKPEPADEVVAPGTPHIATHQAEADIDK